MHNCVPMMKICTMKKTSCLPLHPVQLLTSLQIKGDLALIVYWSMHCREGVGGACGPMKFCMSEVDVKAIGIGVTGGGRGMFHGGSVAAALQVSSASRALLISLLTTPSTSCKTLSF